jgi:hypothetical protein
LTFLQIIPALEYDRKSQTDTVSRHLVLLVVLLGSILALTALVTIIVCCRFKGSITIAVALVLSIFAGVDGASHGPGEILQGNIAPSAIIIEAWPELTILAGEPARKLIPSFSVSGIVTVIIELAVTI